MQLNMVRKYKVFLEGANLLMEIQGVRRFGFFATRYVEGNDVDAAANCALALIRAELAATGAILNNEDDPPTAKITGMEKIGFFERPDALAKGFTFFPERQ